jgi:antitoxin CptB
MDLILGPFADAHADEMGDREAGEFEGLLEEADTALLNWVLGQEEPPAHIDKELLARLVAFRTAAAP